MEANATPSMKVAHEEAATQALIHDQKWEFVKDSFQLLQATQHTFEEVISWIGWDASLSGGLAGRSTALALLQQLAAFHNVVQPSSGFYTC